ncbi:MAG: hypothetical protein ABIA78_00030 [archaeon]
MKKRLFGFLKRERKFRIEFRRQLRMIIIVTISFTIAFTWRQTIFDLSQSFIKLFTNTQNSSTLSILASLFITLISIILIYLTSHYLKNRHSDY